MIKEFTIAHNSKKAYTKFYYLCYAYYFNTVTL